MFSKRWNEEIVNRLTDGVKQALKVNDFRPKLFEELGCLRSPVP